MANPGRRARSKEILNLLLEKADVQGYLTTEDLMEFYPDVSKDAERIEAVMVALRRRGVEILDGDADTELAELEVSPVRLRYGYLLQPGYDLL